MVGEVYQWVILIGLIIGSVTDWRKREVPDWLSYAMFSFGVLFSLLNMVQQGFVWPDSVWPFVNMVMGGLFGLAVSLAFFYSGQWGGGDAKLVIAIGALMGLNIFGLAGRQMLYAFIINSLLAGAAWGVLFAFGIGLKNFSKFKKGFKEMIYSRKVTNIRWIVLVLTAGLLVLGMMSEMPLKMLYVLLGLLVFLTFYLSVIIKSIEKTCMIKKLHVKKLVEGDWIVNDVVVKGKVVVKQKKIGLESKDIKKLLELHKKKKLTHVVVKEGIPFVPGFLLGYVITWLWEMWFVDLVIYVM